MADDLGHVEILLVEGLGVNSYIVKPVDFSQFNETIAKAGLYWLVVNKTPA